MPEPAYRADLIAALTRILGIWTSPDFLTAVAAREGVHLDPGAIVLITLLSRHGATRPSGLATQMVTGASNVSKIVGRLTKTGLVVRTADPSDARAQLVELTDAGHHVAGAFVRAGNGLVDELLSGWTETDRLAFTAMLQRFEHSALTFSARLLAGTTPTEGDHS